MEEATEAEREAAVEAGKSKKEAAVARARCWKGFLLRRLKTTGESFSWQ